jgi:NADPH-dependent F420 reductase
VVVSVVVPLRPPRVSVAWRPEAGSAAAEAQALVGPDIPVVAAFQHVSATKLMDLDADLGCDVLVCGDDLGAKRAAMGLVTACGAIGFDAGPLENAGVVEGMTSVLIGLNQRLGVRGAGLRVTNVPR